MKKNQSRGLETIKKGAEKGTEWKRRWGKGGHSVLYEERKRLGCMGVRGGVRKHGEEARLPSVTGGPVKMPSRREPGCSPGTGRDNLAGVLDGEAD